jgi:7-keto-8-aminopelargonate synthetase-like enzyme
VRTIEERLAVLDQVVSEAAARGLALQTLDDAPLDGRTISLAGRPRLNFGSCSYLGLELDPRLRDAVIAAVTRYGTQFSSSRAYVSAAPYRELEARLDRMFGGYALVTPTTSLGHLAALPVLVGSTDAVVLDQQVHASVQLAANQLRLQEPKFRRGRPPSEIVRPSSGVSSSVCSARPRAAASLTTSSSIARRSSIVRTSRQSAGQMPFLSSRPA